MRPGGDSDSGQGRIIFSLGTMGRLGGSGCEAGNVRGCDMFLFVLQRLTLSFNK